MTAGTDDHGLDCGRMERPAATVLPEEALVPEECVVRPAPTVFTHQLTAELPFRYTTSDQDSPPAGVLAAGSRVVLEKQAGDICQVIDGRGLRLTLSCRGLRHLS